MLPCLVHDVLYLDFLLSLVMGEEIIKFDVGGFEAGLFLENGGDLDFGGEGNPEDAVKGIF